VQRIDGHDHASIAAAIEEARAETTQPSLIIARTHIAEGSPHKVDTPGAHGSPLGPEETKATKEALGWPQEPTFHVPPEVRELFAAQEAGNRKRYESWRKMMTEFRERNADRAELYDRMISTSVPADIARSLLDAAPREAGATRSHGGKVLQKAAALVPSLVGGAADLVESTKTIVKDSTSVTATSFIGRNIHFGIREHAMGAVCNGLAAYGSFIPFGSTFLIFSDYMRPSIRLAALSDLQSIFVFTHDSVLLGEDGPTHQPIEQLWSLREIPNMHVIRPADGPETALAWAYALSRKDAPTCIALTRQEVPVLDHEASPEPFGPETFSRGGYVLLEASTTPPRLTIVATGSEVGAAVEARRLLEADGVPTRVVSMPCVEMFQSLPPGERERVIPAAGDARVAVVEAGAPHGWHRVVGGDALVIGLERFGASAPAKVLADRLGFTGPRIAERIKSWLKEG